MTVRPGWPQALLVGHAATTDEPIPIDFRSVFEDTFDYVWLTLRRLGVRERDLEDVTHDVFVVVHRHLDTYDRERPIRPWLFAFAIRAAADYRRLARHRVELRDDPSTLADPGPGPHEQAVTRERLDLVALALDALDFDRRAIFVLHHIDEVPVNQAALILGIPVNTAHSRLRLASTLPAERALLDRARRDLLSGEAPAALEEVETHARLFRHGLLSEERDALRVEALVAAQRYEPARAAGARFHAAYPGSMLGPAVEGALRTIP